MSDPLGSYLNDHVAGAAHPIDLVEFMRDRYEGEEIGQFAAWLLAEIESDREVLRELTEHWGGRVSKVKELAGLLGEKVNRLNCGMTLKMVWACSKHWNFWRLEFTESWNCGARWLWWQPANPRLSGIDFEHLANRAEKQRAEVERRRLQVAQFIFGADERGGAECRGSRRFLAATQAEDWQPRASGRRVGGHCRSGFCARARPGALHENTCDVNGQ